MVMQEPDIKVFPNPTTDYLRITQLPLGVAVELYDMSGKSILQTKSNKDEMQLNVQGLTAGNYILRIEGYQQKFKIIKK